MGNIKIIFDPFQEKNVIALNGETMSRQSRLGSYVNTPLLTVGRTLLEDLSGEIGDDYELSVVGTEFEEYFLKDLKQQCSDCTNVTVEPIDIKERFAVAQQTLNCDTDAFKEKIYVASELHLALDSRLAIAVSDVAQATVCVARDRQQAREMTQTGSAKLVLYVSDKNQITYEGRDKCLWGVQANLLPSRLQAVVERFAIPRYLNQAEQLAQIQNKKSAKETVETLKRIGVRVTVSVPKEAIEGDVLTPVFTADGEMPKIRMDTSRPQVIEIREGKLVATGEGTSTVRFYKGNEFDAFETVEIQVKGNTFLKTVRLSAPDCLKPGQTCTIEAVFVPMDSPEIQSLRWTVQDPTVAMVDQAGNIRALKAGKTVITAQASRTGGSVEITVLPVVEQILLSKDKLSLTIAQKEQLEVTVLPAGCDASTVSCKSTNPTVAVAERNENGGWTVKAKGITAKGEGHCRLIFTDADGHCNAECDVTVISSITKRRKKEVFLTLTAVMTLITFVLQFFPKPFGIYGAIAAAVIAVLLGIVGIIKNGKDAFWELLLMAICVWIAIANAMK